MSAHHNDHRHLPPLGTSLLGLSGGARMLGAAAVATLLWLAVWSVTG